MDEAYLRRVAANLFPVSVERRDLKRALAEWEYHGNTYDLEAPDETCQLCDHPDIRFQFEIVNRHNSNPLLIGSECIKRFEIGVIEEGQRLGKEAAARRVDADRSRLITEAKTRRVITALVALSSKDEDFEIVSFIEYYRAHGAFTPNQLSTLLWRLGRHQVAYRRTDFKMKIRRGREQSQLLEMPEWKVRQIWPCMCASQKKWYLAHCGRAPAFVG